MKKILSILGITGCAMSGFATDYYADQTVIPTNFYWNTFAWSKTKTIVNENLVNGPIAGDSIEFNAGGTFRPGTLYILEQGEKIGGLSSSDVGFKAERLVTDLYVRQANQDKVTVTTSGTAVVGVEAILLKITGTASTVRGSLVFLDGATKMNVDVAHIDIGTIKTTIGQNALGTVAGTVSFGDSTTALNSVKVGLITTTDPATGTSARNIEFNNVTGDVEVGSVASSTYGVVKFSKIGGNIIFGTDVEGNCLNFATLGMSDLKLSGSTTKIIFKDLSLFETSETPYTLMTWTTLTGTATSSDIYNAIEESEYGTFALNGNSIEFIRNAIPEPAEVGALLGLIAVGFVAYRRRR